MRVQRIQKVQKGKVAPGGANREKKALLRPLLSLTHWIFRSLTLPYKPSLLVQLMFAGVTRVPLPPR